MSKCNRQWKAKGRNGPCLCNLRKGHKGGHLCLLCGPPDPWVWVVEYFSREKNQWLPTLGQEAYVAKWMGAGQSGKHENGYRYRLTKYVRTSR